MASDNEIPLEITAETGGASKELEAFAKQLNTLFSNINSTVEKNLSEPIKKVEKDAGKFTKGLSDFIGTAKGLAVAAAAIFAGREVAQFFGTAIDEAAAADAAVAKLNFTLAATGEFSAEASQSIQDYASSIQRATTFTDDAVIGAISLAKTFGLTNKAAKELVDSAVNLAAVQGIDLATATDKLLSSLNGQGKALKDLGPQFANLTEEQLKSGEAVRLVQQRFGDAAKTLTSTFSGATTQANNAISDFAEKVGKVITRNPELIKAINFVAQAFNAMSGFVEKNADIFGKVFTRSIQIAALVMADIVSVGKFLSEGFIELGIVVSRVASKFEGMAKAIKGDFKGASLAFQDAATGGGDLATVLKSVRNGMDQTEKSVRSFAVQMNSGGKETDKTANALDKISASAGGAKASFGKATEEALKFAKELENAILNPFQKAASKRDEELAQVSKFLKQGALSAKQASEARLNIEAKYERDVADLKQKASDEEQKRLDKIAEDTKRALEKARKAVEQASANGFEFVISSLKLSDGALNDLNNQIALTIGGIKSLLGGKEGAKELVATAAGAIGDAVIPGIGPAIKDITKVLAQGPEAVKQLVREFVNELPQIVDNIAEAAPAFVEAFIDVMINRGGAIRIGVAIARAMSGEASLRAIGKQIGADVSSSLRAAAIASANALAAPLVAVFASLGPSLRQQIADGFTEGSKKLGLAVADFSAQFGANILNAVVTAGQSFGQAVINAFSSAGPFLSNPLSATLDRFNNIGAQLSNPLSGALDRIPNLANEFADKIKNALGTVVSVGGGGGGGVVGTVRSALGFAEGGLVPPGFPNDTFPARLTSGELIIPKDLVGGLAAFLDGSGSRSNAGTDLQAALLGKIASLLSAPMTVQTVAEVNGKAFADIILNLSRNNARLTA